MRTSEYDLIEPDVCVELAEPAAPSFRRPVPAAPVPAAPGVELAASVEVATHNVVAAWSVRTPREFLDAAGFALTQHPDIGPRLGRTARAFPHVVNRLSAVWTEPDRVLSQLQGLLLNDRADRQGFPLAIVQELAELRLHYEARVAPVFRAMQARSPAVPRSVRRALPAKPGSILARLRSLTRRMFKPVLPN